MPHISPTPYLLGSSLNVFDRAHRPAPLVVGWPCKAHQPLDEGSRWQSETPYLTTDIPLEIILIPDLGGKPFELDSLIFTNSIRAYRVRSRGLSVSSIKFIVPHDLRIVG